MQTNWTKHWNDLNNSFVWKAGIWLQNRAYKNLLKHTTLKNPTIVELGSGSGANSLFLAQLLNSPKVTLVDFNKEGLAISKKLFKKAGFDLISF